MVVGVVVMGAFAPATWSQPADKPSAASDAEDLEAEVKALQERLKQLEARMGRCEAQLTGQTAGGSDASPSFTVEPAASLDPADGLPGAAPARSVSGLPATGQTLVEKVRFLEGRCLKTVRCAGPLVQKKTGIPGMQVDETRRYSSLVSRCAHQCAVEIAVSDAVARSPSPPAPDEAVGLRTPGSKGLPGYPGDSGDLPSLRDFLDVRCRDVACARLSLSTAGEGAGPAVLDFLRTCAKACAEQKNLSEGQ
jgi:outer membrane murein-binding lipoprotein Lpp